LADAFIVTVGTTDYKAAGVEEWTVKGGKTTVKVVLTADCVTALKAAYDETGQTYGDYGDNTGLLVTGAGGTIKLAGEFMVSETGKKAGGTADAPIALTGTDAASPITVADKWAPSYKSMTVTNSTYGDTEGSDITNNPDKFDTVITLKFSEVITGTNASMFVQDLVVKNAKGETLTPAEKYVTKVDSGDVVIIIPDVQVPLGTNDAKYTVASKDAITYIKDGAGNKIGTFGAKEIKNP
jgi:hypothetical protein